ncbi:unnamed protein product, partial [Staurois parvus]
ATYLSPGLAVSRAARFTGRPLFQEAGIFSVGTSSAALHEWSCSLLGPVTCPKRIQGGRTLSVSDRLGDRTGSGSRYLSNSGTRSLKVPILNGEQSLKRNFPLWVELRF